MTWRSAFIILLVALTLTGCNRVDPLAVIDAPHSHHSYHHYLLGNDEQIICVFASAVPRYTSENADVFITSIDHLEDVRVSWTPANDLEVLVQSGAVERVNPRSQDGAIRINVIEN